MTTYLERAMHDQDDRFVNEPPRPHPRVRGLCPSCGSDTLFLGSNGYVTCSLIGCKDPGAAHDLLEPDTHKRAAAEISERRAWHIAFNVAIRQNSGSWLPACDGPTCKICSLAANVSFETVTLIRLLQELKQ